MTEIVSVPNPRIQSIRDRLDSDTSAPVPQVTTIEFFETYGLSFSTLNTVISILYEGGPMTASQIIKVSGLGDSTVRHACQAFENIGAVTVSKVIGPSKKSVKCYQYKSLPQGCSFVDLASVHHPKTSHSSPGVNDTNEVPRFFTQKPRTVSIERINGYEQLIADTTRHYGIGELDELITAIHSVCIERIMSATGKCPICQSTLKRNRSAVSCNKCNITLDLGDTKRSLTAFLAMAEQLKGAGQ